MRAGRGRPRAAMAGLAAWIAVTVLGLVWGPPGVPLLFAVLGVYLVGPLWIPVRYRLDGEGFERATAFGRRRWSWAELGAWEIHPAGRTGYLYPRGRGSARFLPPVLLLWEAEAARAGLAGRLAGRLGERLEGRVIA